MNPQTPRAPWPDFAGRPIYHGDLLQHLDGSKFVAIRLANETEEIDAWRAVYDGPNGISRLGLQIGDKGRGVYADQLQAAFTRATGFDTHL